MGNLTKRVAQETEDSLSEILKTVREIQGRLEDYTQIISDKLLIIENLLKMPTEEPQMAHEVKKAVKAQEAAKEIPVAKTEDGTANFCADGCPKCNICHKRLKVKVVQKDDGSQFNAFYCLNWQQHPKDPTTNKPRYMTTPVKPDGHKWYPSDAELKKFNEAWRLTS